MKKLLNGAGDVVDQLVAGTVAGNPGLRILPESHTVIRSDIADVAAAGLVAVITGGGAGHEPAHAGYVGAGMLSAAVSGEVFTSPSVDAVLEAIRAAATSAGVLLIVKSYTGDRLNFGLAAEIARAEGIRTRMVIVADDVALARSAENAGRRGIAGTVLIHKIAGAAAAAGLALDEVAEITEKAAANLASMGVGLGSCIVPAAGKPTFELGHDEVEWGLGIHGEPGVERSAAVGGWETVKRLLDACIEDLDLRSGDPVALLVNNLGGSSTMEINVIADSALRYLDDAGILVERVWTGSFLTAMEMPGCSLSLLRTTDDILQYLDAPALTSAWPAAHLGRRPDAVTLITTTAQAERRPVTPAAERADPALTTNGGGNSVLTAILTELLEAEPALTEMDQLVGDGDLGTSLARGALGVIQRLEVLPSDPAGVLRSMSEIVRRVVGGTSGPLYAILLLKASTVLEGVPDPDAGQWAAALDCGVAGIEELGGAAQGDRTMIDALRPAADAMRDAGAHGELAAAVAAAARAARSGAEATSQMSPRRGRSSYAGDRVLGHPDPGAWAVALWLEAAKTALETSAADATV